MALKVLMMGGYRCGKTSALASLFAQMIHGHANKYLTISDRTPIQNNDLYISLNDKELELQNLLELHKENSSIFLADRSPSIFFKNYKLHLQIPGTHQEMDIDFLDSAGHFFEYGGQHAEETANYIKDCDVFVIVVDTPYLMGSTDEATKDLCPESINLGTNRVNDIQNFLTHIDDNKGQDAKMVVFVPLKCEKWAKEPNGLNKVTARIKEVYATHIKYLSAFGKMNISIIPMQTSGNILFSEFRKASIYNSLDGNRIRCCRIDDEIIRKENGDHVTLMAGETVIEDEHAIIYRTNLCRPNAWYQINPRDHSYSPKNCDQLLFHILRFVIFAFRAAEREGTRFPFIPPPNNRYQKWLGTIGIEALEKAIVQMERDGVIKDNCDGIEIIKRF